MSKYKMTVLMAVSLLAYTQKSFSNVTDTAESGKAHATKAQSAKNPYQDVFDKIAPVLRIKSTDIKSDTMYIESLEDVTVPAFTISDVIKAELENEMAAIEAMERLGWKVVFMAAGDGSGAGLVKDGHQCNISTNFDEEKTGMSEEELWMKKESDKNFKVQVFLRVSLTCGQHPVK